MTKVLYITTLYDVVNSSAAIRNNSLVKGLNENGCEVDVYTVKWPEHMRSRFFQKEINGNIYYTDLTSIALNNKLKNLVKSDCGIFIRMKKVIKDVIFFPDVCHSWDKNINITDIENYNLIITSSDFKSSHFVGELIKSKYHAIQWVQIWGDPWSTDINTPFYLKPLIKIKERELLRKCDNIVYISEPTAEEMKKKYPAFIHKITFIPRSFYFRVEKVGKEDYSEPIHIVYSGAVGFGRKVEEIIEATVKYNIISENQKIILDFYSNISDNLKKFSNYDCVQLHGIVDFGEMKEIYENADILLYISNDSSTTQIPGKLFDYLGTNLPIFCLVNNQYDEIYSFIKQHEQCLVINNDRNSIFNQLMNINEIIQNRITIDDRYSPSAIAQQLLNLVNVI